MRRCVLAAAAGYRGGAALGTRLRIALYGPATLRHALRVSGLYDGFEGYRVSASSELAEALLHGLVAVDANTLLNLYRYNSGTTDDLFNVLERLGSRLFVPHQSLREFWRNRIAAIGNPASAADQAVSAFEKNRRSTVEFRSRA